MRCLKLCPSLQDPVQAKIYELSYEMVSKDCLTKLMEFPYRFIISAKYGPLKCTFKLEFQMWTLPDIKLIIGHKF